ncbi:MAG: hypothetical protein QOH26_821 [Actinomycetota bacterium]|nr:hypothetical protein [Actinomycetota bacterium]
MDANVALLSVGDNLPAGWRPPGDTEGRNFYLSSELARFYSEGADDYHELWAPELLKLSRSMIERLPLEDANRILDAGAGVGSLLPELSSRAPSAQVVGADLAEGMIALAPKDFGTAVMDARHLGFQAASFDVVVLAFVLFHVDDPGSVLAEALRVLQPGGTVGTVTWGEDPSYLALDVWNDELQAHGAPPPVGGFARYDTVNTTDKVRSLLAAMGFTGVGAWTGLYENRMTLEGFLRHRTGHGMSRLRFEALADDARASCIQSVRARLEDVGPAGFVDRTEVIYAMAERGRILPPPGHTEDER